MPLADTQAVALAVRRAPSTIRCWAHNNLITRRGVDAKGRALYDLDEVADLAAALDAAENAACLDKAPDLRQHLNDCRSSVSLSRDRLLPAHLWSLPVRRVLALLAVPLFALAMAAPAMAGSAHFVGTPVLSASGATITVTAKEAGLGDLAQIHVVLSGTASCVNGGGNNPQAANKTTFSVAADEPVQNGHSDYTLSATAVFDPSSPCPDPQSVQYSGVTLTDTTNSLTFTF